jgi:DNA invertase Pin-like site-specific DNA recombinase
MRIGYSYMRYSSPVQGDGDSIRRQTTGTEAWCERNAVQLDTTLTDPAISAFRGKQRRKGHLARFLADVQAERIPRGSVLIIENLDRLSRENPWDAVPLLCSIVNAGIDVVTLTPSEYVYKRGKDLAPLLLAVCEFTRGHSESASKADRLTELWSARKQQARDKGQPITTRCPAWLQVVDQERIGKHVRGGRFALIPERVQVVKDIFRLAIAGRGLFLIVQHLTDTGVPVWGVKRRDGRRLWTKAYVRKILTERVVLGEHQPHKAGKPDGQPILGYYPAIIDEATWEQAQAALARRKNQPGRIGRNVASLFTGLLWDAKTHGRMLIAWQTSGSKAKRSKKRVLVSADSMEGRTASVSFPNEVFEEAILDFLQEINPADVLGKEPEGEAQALQAERTALEARMAQLEQDMAKDDQPVQTLVRSLRNMNDKRQDLLKREKLARQKEANPQGAAWEEAQSLLAVAVDEATRLRLCDLLATIIQDIWLLVVPSPLQARPTWRPKDKRINGTKTPRPSGSHRFAAVQINFKDGAQRHYLIHHQAAGNGRPGGSDWVSVRWEDHELPGQLDLRQADDARQLAEVLSDPELLTWLKTEHGC